MTPGITTPSTDIIDRYFAESSTQGLISEIETIRLQAYNAKRNFYKKYMPLLVVVYILIGIGLYFGFQSFGASEGVVQFAVFGIVTPAIVFASSGQAKQTSLLGTKKVVTSLFDNFIQYILPGSQFNETQSLYTGDPLTSELFIDTRQKTGFFASTVDIKKDIRNSITLPLLHNENNEVNVSLEGVEVCITKTTGSGKSRKTETDMAMLYKIIFNNPRRTIYQSVKIIPDSNSRFKEKDNLLTLEHQQFEQAFDVYSADPVEARMILTPNVMDRLAQFMNNKSINYSFNFINNTFYIKRDLSHGISINSKKILGMRISEENHASLIDIDRDNSIEKNKNVYRDFYNEMMSIQQLTHALNVEYFNKLS